MRKSGQPKGLKKFLPLDAEGAPILTRMTTDKDKTSATGYMCAIDWQDEIGHASDGNRVYPSIDALKEHHECWAECGIVEVCVTFKKIVAKSQY
jgi:hypothetical protein